MGCTDGLVGNLRLWSVILTIVKIFQFLHNLYCISEQYVLCRKENLIVRKYRQTKVVDF